MKKTLLFLIIAQVLTMSSCVMTPSKEVTSSTPEELANLDLSQIDKIVLENGGVEVTVVQASAPKLQVDNPDNEPLRLEVKGNELLVKGRNHGFNKPSGAQEAQLNLQLPKLNSIKIYGAMNAEIKGFTSNEFKAEIEGAGNISMNQMQIKKGTLLIQGTGNINLDCLNADVVDATIQGAGNISLSGNIKQVKKRIDGVGSIDFN